MMDMPFPKVVDNTMLAVFRACPQKARLSFIEHYKPKQESVHLVAGAAFARGIEVARRQFFERGLSQEDAVAIGLHALIEAYGDFEPPEDSAKNLARMLGALEFYFDRYPMEDKQGAIPIELPGGKRAIEFSFAEPLGVRHPDTGEPILYAGRSDAICAFAGGVYVTDEKTTSSLGASWARQWDLRSQFTGYCWAATQNPILPPITGVLVRGVSILKTKYDTAQAITARSKWEIERWLWQVEDDLERMISCWKRDRWGWNLDDACSSFGGCHFVPVCKSPDPAPWLELYFERRAWNPLNRTETLLLSDEQMKEVEA